jgi:GNAT superfamily N-acetyltransferase
VRRGDEQRLRDLRLRALAQAPAAFGATADEEAALAPSHWAQLAQRSEESDHLVICVAIDGEEWLGMAAGRWFDQDRRIAALWGMWVDPGARRLGVGERLVDGVCAWAAGHGAGFVRLGVITRPDDATPFYEQIGFVRTGEAGPMRRDPSRSVHFLARPV